jgi:ABC-2 type transport system permease protein
MNTTMLHHLIRKDLYFGGKAAAFYFLAGLLSLIPLCMDGGGYFYFGSVLLISALVGLSAHPAMQSVITERTEKNLLFVMSLPVSPRDVTVSKLVSNLLMFYVPWTMLLGATWIAISVDATLTDGLIPFATVVFGIIAVNAMLILAAAMLTGSSELTISTMVACNLAFQGVLYIVANNPGMNGGFKSDDIVWGPAAAGYLAIEALLIAIVLLLTIWLRSRKTDII